MKLTNTSRFDTKFLRKLLAWCRKQVGLEAKRLKSARFTNLAGHAFAGRAWPWEKRILVRIGPDRLYPRKASNYRGAMQPAHQDAVEGLVDVTAHELLHLAIYHDRLQVIDDRYSRADLPYSQCAVMDKSREESFIVVQAAKVLEKFRSQRLLLEPLWRGQKSAPVIAQTVFEIPGYPQQSAAVTAAEQRK